MKYECIQEDFLTRLFNRILETEKMLNEWRESVLVLNYQKGDVQSSKKG